MDYYKNDPRPPVPQPDGFYSHQPLPHPVTHLDDRPPHLAAAQPVLAAGGEEGRLRQEHPRNRGEEDHAGQGEEAEEAIHCYSLGLCVYVYIYIL